MFVVQWLHPPQILHCTSDDLVHVFGTMSINRVEPTTLKVCTLKYLHLHCCWICESFVSWGKDVAKELSWKSGLFNLG